MFTSSYHSHLVLKAFALVIDFGTFVLPQQDSATTSINSTSIGPLSTSPIDSEGFIFIVACFKVIIQVGRIVFRSTDFLIVLHFQSDFMMGQLCSR